MRLVQPADRFRAQSELHARILDAFNEHGVQIMSPHFTEQPAKPVLGLPVLGLPAAPA